MDDADFIEVIDGKSVKINPVPGGDFDGFGWAIRVIEEPEDTTLFGVIIECGQKQDDATRQQVLNIGREIVRQRLKYMDFQLGSKYCYNWDSNNGLLEIDCQKRPKIVPVNSKNEI